MWGRYDLRIKRTTQFKVFFKLVRLKPSLDVSADRTRRPPPPVRRSAGAATPTHYDGNRRNSQQGCPRHTEPQTKSEAIILSKQRSER